MALNFPTPPAPPTPPTVPRVVLEGGGSVKEMPRPKSYGPKSDSEINEQKARDAVANGSGPLSKTTTEKDDSRNTKVEGNLNKSGDDKTGKDTVATKKSRDSESAQETREQYIDLKEFEGDKGQTQNQALTQSKPFSVRQTDTGHGVFYWGFTIISVLALLIYLAKKFLIKNSQNEYSFSKRDLSYLREDGESTVSSSPLKPAKSVVKNYEIPKTDINKPKEVKRKKEEPESGHFEVRI